MMTLWEKTEYIPLMDGDEKTGNTESKQKPCSDTSQAEGTSSSEPTLLASGDHGPGGKSTTGSYLQVCVNSVFKTGVMISHTWNHSPWETGAGGLL